MILQNGYVSFDFGEYIESPTERGVPNMTRPQSLSAPVPCQWRVVRKDLQAKSSSGQHEVSSTYEILLDDREKWCERLKLSDMAGNELGIFSVIQDEHLHILNIRRLMV